MDASLSTAQKIRQVTEPIAANVYFAPEVHEALTALGYNGSPGTRGAVHSPNMVAYFTSRGACLGPNVDGHLVASAFGVFRRPTVVEAVEAGWQIADQPAVLAAREKGAVASLRRILGDDPDGLAWATQVLQRMAGSAPGEGRALFSGLQSLGYPADLMGQFWRAADLVREHRGDSHIAAWVGADLDATEIGLLTDPWRGQALKSWVRTRGWSDEELDAGCERLRSRGYLNGDELTAAGHELRTQIESATDQMEARLVTALGDDADQLVALLDPWCDQIVAAGGYPARVR
jgi:hypothetical protein